MVVIDRCNRVELSDLKPLFINANRIKQGLERWEREHPSKTEEDIILFRRELLSKKRDYLSGMCNFKDGLSICIEAALDFVDTMEVEGFSFRWEYEGKPRYQYVKLEKRPSNLGLSAPVYYLVCPYSGTLCRKLYTDGRTISGRRSFSHIYETQTRSRKVRDFDTLMEVLEPPAREKYRKEHYRGRLTPYGWKRGRDYRASRKLGISNIAEALRLFDLMMVGLYRAKNRVKW